VGDRLNNISVWPKVKQQIQKHGRIDVCVSFCDVAESSYLLVVCIMLYCVFYDVVILLIMLLSSAFDSVYCRMLVHDTMLNRDSYRTITADTPICDCGHALETTKHFLLHCNIYEKEVKDMFDFIYHSGITTKQNKSSIRGD